MPLYNIIYQLYNLLPLSYSLTSFIESISSCKSSLSNYNILIIRSIILSPSSLSLSLKILFIFKSFIRGTVLLNLI